MLNNLSQFQLNFINEIAIEQDKKTNAKDANHLSTATSWQQEEFSDNSFEQAGILTIRHI